MTLMESASELQKGEKAPGFGLENTEGKEVELSDLDNYDGVLVVFMCNHCPFVKANLPELSRLIEEFPSVAFVGINPNSDVHPQDTVEKMPELVEEYGLESENFYYLADPDQEVAESYGATCTPDPFLLNMRHRLFYQGRLSDKTSPSDDLTEHEMQQVMEDMLKSRDPPEEQKPSQGCSIKWKK